MGKPIDDRVCEEIAIVEESEVVRPNAKVVEATFMGSDEVPSIKYKHTYQVTYIKLNSNLQELEQESVIHETPLTDVPESFDTAMQQLAGAQPQWFKDTRELWTGKAV